MTALAVQGETADRLLLQDQLTEAEAAYRDIIAQAQKVDPVDVFILSKCYLGLIIAEAKKDAFDKVQQYLNSELKDESIDHWQRLAIFGLKKGMVSKDDYTIFHNLSLFCTDATKHEPMRQKLRQISLSPWMPPTEVVTVFDRGTAYETNRNPDGSIRKRGSPGGGSGNIGRWPNRLRAANQVLQRTRRP